jgi:hypothetical protein
MVAGLGEQMIKCVNCPEAAVYTVADPGVNPLDYCGSCLPHWLRERANTNHFPLVTPVSEKSSKKKADAEAPVDESN